VMARLIYSSTRLFQLSYPVSRTGTSLRPSGKAPIGRLPETDDPVTIRKIVDARRNANEAHRNLTIRADSHRLGLTNVFRS
jgi:hypothetical protein